MGDALQGVVYMQQLFFDINVLPFQGADLTDP